MRIIENGDTVTTAMNKINQNFVEIYGGTPDDMVKRLMDMQKRLIDQLTEENKRLKDELHHP